MVEQWIENPRVGGSIPPLGTMIKSLTLTVGLFGFERLAFSTPPSPSGCNPRPARTRIFCYYTDMSTSKMDYLIWAIPAALWVIVSLDAASRQTPLLLLDRTHKL